MSVHEIQLESFQIIGIKTRTSNADEMQGAGKISKLWSQFYSEQVMNKISNKLDQSVMGVYYDYESDADSPYSLLIGVKVKAGTEVPAGMEVLTIPAQTYYQFTTKKGLMPNIVIDEWQNVWKQTKEGKISRSFSYDFEVYDERSADPESAVVEILIAKKG